MNDEQKYVEDRWDEIYDSGYAVNIYSGDNGYRFPGQKNRYIAAKAFTEQREKEITEVEEEIRVINNCIDYGAEDALNRILAVEQDRLKALKQGMKT